MTKNNEQKHNDNQQLLEENANLNKEMQRMST